MDLVLPVTAPRIACTNSTAVNCVQPEELVRWLHAARKLRLAGSDDWTLAMIRPVQAFSGARLRHLTRAKLLAVHPYFAVFEIFRSKREAGNISSAKKITLPLAIGTYSADLKAFVEAVRVAQSAGAQGCVIQGSGDASLQKLATTLRQLADTERVSSRPCSAVEARSYMATIASAMASLAHLGDSFLTAVGDWTAPPSKERTPTIYVRIKLARSAWSKCMVLQTVHAVLEEMQANSEEFLMHGVFQRLKVSHIDAARTEASAMWSVPEAYMTPTQFGTEFVACRLAVLPGVSHARPEGHNQFGAEPIVAVDLFASVIVHLEFSRKEGRLLAFKASDEFCAELGWCHACLGD